VRGAAIFCKHRTFPCAIALLLIALLTATSRADDAPSITRLFPPGAQRGTSAEVKLTGKPGDGILQVHTDESLAITFNEKKDTATIAVAETAAPGLHWLRFFNEYGATDPLPFVVGLIPEQQETEPNNLPAEATPLDKTTVTLNGVLDQKLDVDCFSFELNEGQTIVAAVEANSTLGAPMDAVLQITNEHGTVLAQNDDDHGFDPLIAFTAPSTGTYCTRLFAFPAKPNSSIRLATAKDYTYRLTLSTAPFAFNAQPAVLGPETKTVTLLGWNMPADASALVDGANVTTKFSSLPLMISRVPYPSLVENASSETTLEVPFAMTGCIAKPNEVDTFQLKAKAGDRLTLAVAARSINSLLDPVLTVTSSDGKVIKEADDRSRSDLDAEAAVKISKDGDYTIAVTDRYQTGGPRHFYVLTTERTEPKYSASVSAGKFIVKADKPLEIPVTIDRQNGFDQPIAISIEGLPEHLSCEAVTSNNDDDTKKKVTLKLEAATDALPWSGVVQITCQAESSETSETATAAVPKSSNRTESLWLTVMQSKPEE